jgi:hypothetical protein
MDKVFILHHCINEAYETNFLHNIEDTFKSKEGALKAFNDIKEGIKNGTAHYFKDTEVEEVDSPLSDRYVAYATYEWIAEDGATMYTKFYITEHTPKD